MNERHQLPSSFSSIIILGLVYNPHTESSHRISSPRHRWQQVTRASHHSARAIACLLLPPSYPLGYSMLVPWFAITIVASVNAMLPLHEIFDFCIVLNVISKLGSLQSFVQFIDISAPIFLRNGVFGCCSGKCSCSQSLGQRPYVPQPFRAAEVQTQWHPASHLLRSRWGWVCVAKRLQSFIFNG
jgi:hypothetical protein